MIRVNSSDDIENFKNIDFLFDYLSKEFKELFLVGGSLRDYVLSFKIKDFDFAVPYTPNKIKHKLNNLGVVKVFDIGERFGTIGCSINNLDVEITTFRGEQYNYINRKPEVSYIQNIEQDVERRDFTINSLYINKNEFKLEKKINEIFKDKHRNIALEDIFSEKISTVGNPAKRFKEDPLRMLRAVRFACKYNFTITTGTFEMIRRLRVELLKVSVERWTLELDKILQLKKPDLKILADSELLNIMIPELSYQIGFDQNSKYHDLNLWGHTVKVVQSTPCDNLNLRWAALLHDIGKPFVKTVNKKGNYNYMGHEVMSAHLVEQIGKRLKWDNGRIKKITELCLHHLNDYCELRRYDQEGKNVI